MVAQLVCHRRCRRKMKMMTDDDEVADYFVSTGRVVTVETTVNLTAQILTSEPLHPRSSPTSLIASASIFYASICDAVIEIIE